MTSTERVKKWYKKSPENRKKQSENYKRWVEKNRERRRLTKRMYKRRKKLRDLIENLK